MTRTQVSMEIKEISYGSAKWQNATTLHVFLTTEVGQLSLFLSRGAVERISELLATAFADYTDEAQLSLPHMESR